MCSLGMQQNVQRSQAEHLHSKHCFHLERAISDPTPSQYSFCICGTDICNTVCVQWEKKNCIAIFFSRIFNTAIRSSAVVRAPRWFYL